MPEELALKMPTLSDQNSCSDKTVIYAHILGIIGDWYLSHISKDRKIAYGYQLIESEPAWEMSEWFENSKKWNKISLIDLQHLVDERFLKEKDIRFLITRDLFWVPKTFSEISIDKQTLSYPGKSDRVLF